MPSIPARIRMPRARRGARRRPAADPERGSPVGAPGGRGAGEPLDLGEHQPARSRRARCRHRRALPGASAALTTLAALGHAEGRVRPRHRLHAAQGLCAGRRDHEAISRRNIRAIPWSRISQYWLGESYFQRQQYRDAAEAFLGVTTKFDKSAKAPDALLRLGQSLAALKEKEAACAALGEVTRKYPRASSGRQSRPWTASRSGLSAKAVARRWPCSIRRCETGSCTWRTPWPDDDTFPDLGSARRSACSRTGGAFPRSFSPFPAALIQSR